jgi:hypothetical protein
VANVHPLLGAIIEEISGKFSIDEDESTEKGKASKERRTSSAAVSRNADPVQ